MPQEKITIKFLPDGDEKLIAAINKLSVSTKKLTGATNETAVATKRATRATDEYRIRGNQLAKGNDAIAKSFATIRSQMLLFTFAMSLGVRQVIGFIKEAAKVDSMSRAFDSLSGGAGNAKIALTQLSDAAGGTMSQFDLLQQANNALILGVVKNSDEMNEMFKVAIKLGRAVGRTAKESVESLVTGIGRQSRLMLDNIGIIMDAEKAYSTFAAELGVTVESLDDAERRQAFLSATMESAREKARLLGDDIETMQSRIEKATAAMSDAKVELGKASVSVFNLDTNIGIFTKTLRLLLKPMEDVTNTDLNLMLQTTARAFMLANPRLMGFAKLLGISVSGLKPFSEATDDANNKQIEFNRNLKENNEKIQKKANELIAETVAGKMKAISVTIDFVKANKDLFKSEQNVVDVLAMLEKQYKDLDPAEKERIENLKDLEKQNRANAIAMRQSERDFNAAVKAINKALDELNQTTSDTIDLENELFKSLDRLILAEMERNALMDGSISLAEEYAMLLERQRQAQEAFDEAIRQGDLAAQADALESLNGLKKDFIELTKLEINDLKILNGEIKIGVDLLKKMKPPPAMDFVGSQITQMEEFLGMSMTVFDEIYVQGIQNLNKGWNMVAGTSNMYFQSVQQGFQQEMEELKNSDAFRAKSKRGQEKAIDDLAKKQKGAKETAWKQQQALAVGEIIMNTASAIINALTAKPAWAGVALAITAGVTGAAQLAIVNSQSMPKFAQGGMIGGRRHSAGGTMIEAEQGEFVMSRSAVQSVGIENLNRMNQGGGGAVTVNVSGNVLSQDFVEGELAEQIKEAIRRGNDFGVS